MDPGGGRSHLPPGRGARGRPPARRPAGRAAGIRHADGTLYGGALDPAEAQRRTEIAAALCRLGARHDEAQAAVAAAAAHVGADEGQERLLGLALAELRSPAPPAAPPPAPAPSRDLADAESALRNLGCTRAMARDLVEQAAAHVGPKASLEDLIRNALSLARPRR